MRIAVVALLRRWITALRFRPKPKPAPKRRRRPDPLIKARELRQLHDWLESRIRLLSRAKGGGKHRIVGQNLQHICLSGVDECKAWLEKISPNWGDSLVNVDENNAYSAFAADLIGHNQLSASLMCDFADDHEDHGTYSIVRMRTIPGRQARSKVVLWSPHMLETSWIFVHPNGRIEPFTWWWACLDGLQWICIGAQSKAGVSQAQVGCRMKDMKWSEIDRKLGSGKKIETTMALLYGIEIGNIRNAERLWHVDVGLAGRTSATLRFTVPPAGMKEVFRWRDRQTGKRRKAAIRNWVVEHDRHLPSGRVVKVRGHLRGALAFTWRGLDVKVYPALYDLESNLRKHRRAIPTAATHQDELEHTYPRYMMKQSRKRRTEMVDHFDGIALRDELLVQHEERTTRRAEREAVSA